MSPLMQLAAVMLIGGAPIAAVGMLAGELVRWLVFRPRQPKRRAARGIRLEREPKLVIASEAVPF